VAQRMSLAISRTDFGDVTVLTLDGRLSLGESSALVWEKIRELLKEGRLNYVLAYGAVRYIDSAGIHALTKSLVVTRNAGGRLVLAGVNPGVDECFALTKLNIVFTIFRTVSEAVDSFGTGEAGDGKEC